MRLIHFLLTVFPVFTFAWNIFNFLPFEPSEEYDDEPLTLTFTTTQTRTVTMGPEEWISLQKIQATKTTHVDRTTVTMAWEEWTALQKQQEATQTSRISQPTTAAPRTPEQTSVQNDGYIPEMYEDPNQRVLGRPRRA